MQPILDHTMNRYGPRRAALLLVLACIGIDGCISLTKKCDCSFGLDYRLASADQMAADGAMRYSIGVGGITIDDQYNHTFLTERGAGGRLIPHEDNCWLEGLDVMAGDLLRGYLLDRMSRPGGTGALNSDGSPAYTIFGRLLEISAMKTGEVAISMEVRVVQGAPNGRSPKVVLAHVFNIRASDGAPPFTTGGDYRAIPTQFSRALVELARKLVTELDVIDSAGKISANRTSPRSPVQPPPSPATQPSATFTLAGADAQGRRSELTIRLTTGDQPDGPGTGTLTLVDRNGEQSIIPVREVVKKRNGLGLKFIGARAGSIDIVIGNDGCRLISRGAVARLPESMPCDCANAQAFLMWRRELKIAVEPAPPARNARARGNGSK